MYYGQAFRKRVLALYDQGLRTKAVAERLGVSKAYCRRVKQRRNEPPRQIGGRAPKLDPAARATLALWIEQRPDATLEELQARIKSELGIAISIGALWGTLRQMKFTFKKSH